ncbi:MAG TPA: hypothetical protein VGH35_11210 [Gaiellaceae bacterium]|jgi:hypothetical protein
MKRLLAVASVAIVVAGAPAYTVAARLASSPQVLTLKVGDVVRVAGSGDIGCRVIRRSGLRTLDCRRAGALTGTYGTLLNKDQLVVVRFLNPHTAKIVLEAEHGRHNPHLCS